MKRHKWILLFLLLGFFACNDDNSAFDLSTEGLELKFVPVAGGAMMYYSLPVDNNIFAMNVRYLNSQGQQILKTCGYSGDSLLLDGFTRASSGIVAQISLVNHRNEESKASEYQFNTLDSAPWAFFEGMKVQPSWNGFQVIYKSPSVVTGMVHVFYLGINPKTHKEDTILVSSFPISQRGDTLNFVVQQANEKNTVIVRSEDFQGYRVRQAVYPDVDAFLTEKWKMTANDFNDFGLSVEHEVAKTGVQYLFDGELNGVERFRASATQNPADQPATEVFASYVAGPRASGSPIVLDMREQKVPAWIRMYCIQPMYATPPTTTWGALGYVWNGCYEDKIPCKVRVYGSKESSDPESGEWEYLGSLNQKPRATTSKERWSYLLANIGLYAPKTEDDLIAMNPIYVDIQFPALDNTYRYLKMVVEDTFWKTSSEIDLNEYDYFTLHELEVYVKKKLNHEK